MCLEEVSGWIEAKLASVVGVSSKLHTPFAASTSTARRDNEVVGLAWLEWSRAELLSIHAEMRDKRALRLDHAARSLHADMQHGFHDSHTFDTFAHVHSRWHWLGTQLRATCQLVDLHAAHIRLFEQSAVEHEDEDVSTRLTRIRAQWQPDTSEQHMAMAHGYVMTRLDELEQEASRRRVDRVDTSSRMHIDELRLRLAHLEREAASERNFLAHGTIVSHAQYEQAVRAIERLAGEINALRRQIDSLEGTSASDNTTECFDTMTQEVINVFLQQKLVACFVLFF